MESKLIDNYIVTNKQLGRGCFGTVYLGYLKEDRSKWLAVKQIELKNVKGDLRQLKRQMDLLMKLESPNIVKFYKPLKTERNLYFFLEYCQQDLKTYLKSKGGYLSEAEAFSIFKQICNGFKVLQQNNVIHRDIKPANILIHKGVAKITDFGFARVVDDVDQQVAHTFLGTPLYMAPQILNKQKFSGKCDVWSLGVTFYEMLYGKTPFTAKNPYQLLENIRKQKLEFPANPLRSEAIKSLVAGMLVPDEQKRYSWNDIFIHELIIGKVKEKFNQINTKFPEGLEKTFKINELYVANNRVLGQDQLEEFDSTQMSKKQSVREKVESKGDVEADLKYQQLKIQQERIIQRVDSYIKYKRNVAIFINITTNDFFSHAKDSIPETLFFIGVFMLQKYQLYNYQILTDTFSNKRELQRFNSNEWKLYKSSHNYWKTLKAIKSDEKYLKPYFNEVYEKSKRFFDKSGPQPQFQTLYELFKNQHNDALALFNTVAYSKIIDFIATQIEELGVAPKLVKSLQISKDPFKFFKEQTDFNLFYEENDN